MISIHPPQPPPTESVLTAMINELAALPGRAIVVLDDYYLIGPSPVDEALAFLVEHLPPQVHVVIATRDDPPLPLARLRARAQMTELRAVDLRFTTSEATDFLNRLMGLELSREDIAALELRTEGWIAGLQLAAISMQDCKDIGGFIRSFASSHRFVLDYLIEEVLARQPKSIQSFFLQTAIVDRLTGSLCDALTGQDNGRSTLETLEKANLFIVPLDNERLWYRYHHLFAELLRQRLHRTISASSEGRPRRVADLHIRASEWYEERSSMMEAFRHAAAANDVDRAAANQAYTEAVSTTMISGSTFNQILALIGLGMVQELQNQFFPASDNYRRALDLFGDQPQPIGCEAHIGLARIQYQWNDLDAAQHHAELGLALARRFPAHVDRFVACEVFLARLQLARGDAAGAAAMLAHTERAVRRRDLVHQDPNVAAAQVMTLLHQGELIKAADVAQTHQLSLEQARVHLARGNPVAALAVLGPFRDQMEAKGWEGEREVEVLALIEQGLTNPEIAARLYVSPNTVKVHTRNIYGKLGVKNRTQAAARGRGLGILPTD